MKNYYYAHFTDNELRNKEDGESTPAAVFEQQNEVLSPGGLSLKPICLTLPNTGWDPGIAVYLDRSKVMPCSHQFRLCPPDLISTREVEQEGGRAAGEHGMNSTPRR